VLDLRQGTYFFEGLTNRAVLVGNVMASLPVREYVARKAGIPAYLIRATTPTTPDEPRTIADPENPRRTSDILKLTDEYRLKIAANPTVPVLDIYTQAPTAEGATVLADAAVDGLNEYLDTVAEAEGIPSDAMVQLTQLGRARGGVINGGVRAEVTILSLLFVFAISSAAVLYISRVRRGWRASKRQEQPLRRPPEAHEPGEPAGAPDVASGARDERVHAGSAR